jgi:predicted ATPase
MGLAAVNKRLADGLDLLKSAGHGPARHRSLRASLDWDYARLAPAEQAALRRLSALEVSFPSETARAAIADGTMDDWASLDILGALVDKCLVTIEDGAARRCRLPETVRLYARGAPVKTAGKASPRSRG